MKLIDACRRIGKNSAGYLFGGGHGVPLSQVSTHDRLDCSSSCSLALRDAGLFDHRKWALVSGDFSQWGLPGKGKRFTLYYSSRHVFIVFHGTKKRYYRRFDTSPWGFGGRGPRMRRTPRPTIGFKPRHYPGM